MIQKRKKRIITKNEFLTVDSLPLRFVLFLLACIGDAVIIIFHRSLLLIQKVWVVLIRLGLAALERIWLLVIQSLHTMKRVGTQEWHWLRTSLIPKIVKPLTTPIRLKKPKIKLLPKLRLPRFPAFFVGICFGIFCTVLLLFVPYNLYLFIKYLPNPRLLSGRFIPVTTQIVDRNNNLLYEIHGDEDRRPIALKEIPNAVKQATIAIEDRDFYKHRGFSIRAIARAARETYFNKNLQGGSTITQQLIKNSLLTPEITILRKVREVVLAFWTEKIYSKDQILEMYLNQVPYGGTAWGIEAAAQRYFGKSIRDVNLAEAAYLAGLPAAPTLYSPYGSRPELARVRQREVLRRMVEDGYISQEQANIAQSVVITVRPMIENIKAAHFVMYVRQQLAKQYGSRLVDQGGLRIKTTLDLDLQEKTQQIVSQNIASLEKLRVTNGAAMITNPQNGDILTMVGSRDFFNANFDGNVNVTLAQRQPGSSIKVVTYATALENGMTAASPIEDTPISFPVVGQAAYSPVNYDGKFHGTVTLRGALANSYNIPAVKTLNKVGLTTMIDMGQRMGISTWTDRSRFGLSLTLGGGEVTMYDMTQVYGVLANRGQLVELDPFLEVKDYTGKVYYKKTDPKPKPVLSAGVAFILSDILSDNAARSPAFGPNSTLKITNRTVAVKTGTTNEKRDNWTIGYTPSYVVGVWVGNNDNTPMDQQLTSGITGAAPIWNQIMTELLKNKADEPFVAPDTIMSLPCFGKREYFIRGTEPKNGCTPLPTLKPTPQ